MKEKLKKIIKFYLFISLAILPLVTVTNILGIDVFLDSFEKPQHYLSIENNKLLYGIESNEQYLVMQKYSHPEFCVKKNDNIIYFKENGDIVCSKVYMINSINTKNKFYTVNYNSPYNEIIYEKQIIGKIVKIIDNNIWNLISIKFWDISIHNLNIIALIANN